ncbi:MAG: HD domain-containing protein [Acidobacteria bacterium]|nr:MAG: HD domain-containing protein [Acidobacteriota bacterium]
MIAVAALVMENGGDEDEAIAALLHDAPEDCRGSITLQEIEHRFGSRIARIVEGCTDSLESPPPPWIERKRNYLGHLVEADESTLLVSLADKVHNVRSVVSDYRILGEDLWEAFHGGREGKLWYYRTLLEIYRQQAPPRCQPLVDELERAFTELEELSSI